MYVAKHSGKNRYAYYHDDPVSTLIEECPMDDIHAEAESHEREEDIQTNVEGNNVTLLKTRQR